MQKVTKTIFTAILTLTILSLSSYFALAQFPVNIPSTGDQAATACQSAATDAAGNVYITGRFSGTADFKGAGSTHFTLTGFYDLYVAKYNAAGDCLWAFGIIAGGSTADSYIAQSIAVDATGNNIYVTGSFSGTADFKGTSAGPNTLTSIGKQDVFVAKYNAAGAYQWAFNVGADEDAPFTSGHSIAVDAAGNVLVTGTFKDTMDFKGTSGASNVLTISTEDVFVAKYSSAGVCQWAFNLNSLGAFGTGITTDANNNVLITGTFYSTADFKGTSLNADELQTTGFQDAYVAKFNPAGVKQWAFTIGGANSSNNVGNFPGGAIATDAAGNVYVTGNFGANFLQTDGGVSDFKGTSTGPNILTAAGMADAFVAKYDVNGGYQWAFNIGSPGKQANKYRDGIAVDGLGNVYVTGDFGGTPDFKGTAAGPNTLSATGDDDIFVAQYNSAGAYQCAFNIGTGTEINNGRGLAIDAFGNLVVAGNFGETTDFDPSAADKSLTAVGSPNAFISKYSGCVLNTGGGCTANVGVNKSICQGINNSVTIGAAPASGHTYSWSPSAGLSSSTVSQPTATPSTTTTYTLTETVTVSSCQSTATIVVFVGTQPSTPVVSASGPTTFCAGGSVTLNVVSTYAAYSWSNGATTQNINASVPADYSVTVSDAPGCSAASSVTPVTVNPLPSANAGINKGVCPGGSTTIGAASVSGNTYSWLPAAGLSSSTVSQPTASPSATTTYTLTETITATTCQATHSVTVILSPVPSVPVISASGSTTICAGESVTLHVVNTYTTYSWSNGGSTQNINVTTQGSYSVTVTNGSGCSAASSATTVTVNPAPATPGISKKGDTLLCSVTADSYQWYRNSALLTGATNNYYLPTQGGDYTVTITEGGCSATSSPFTWTAIVSVSAGNGQVIIYPLPASAYFIAESKTTALQTITLYDVLGKRVLNAEIKDVSVGADDKKARINIGGLTAGVYFVQLRTAGAVSTLRLVKE